VERKGEGMGPMDENAKPPSPRKSWLSRDLSRENAKPGREIHG